MDSPTFLGIRQQHIKFQATALLDFKNMKNGSEAGLTTYMSNNYHYDLFVKKKNNRSSISLLYNLGVLKHLEKEIPVSGNKLYLRMVGGSDFYTFYYSTDDKNYHKTGEIDVRFLSSETAGGFTGVYLGMFAQSNVENNSYADFDWFEYKELK